MIKTTVHVGRGWGHDLAKRVNAQVRDAVQDAVEEGARVASRESLARRRTGKMAQIDVLPVRGTPTGWEAGFKSRAFYARMQSGGTARGVTALRFLEKGRTAARKYLKARLDRL